MENLLDDYRQEIPPLSDQEIFTRIWTSPRTVFRYLQKYQYDKYVSLLLVLAGINKAFDQASTSNMGDKFSLPVIIVCCAIFGGLFGWIIYYIYAALLSWTGGWLKGSANWNDLLRVIAYSMLPVIVGLAFLVIQMVIYGVEIFRKDGDIVSGGTTENTVFYISILWELTLAIWTIVLTVIGISEVQKFSIGKAILNIFLPGLVLAVPIGVLVLLVFILR